MNSPIGRRSGLTRVGLLGFYLVSALSATSVYALQGKLIVHGPSNLPNTGCNNPVSNGGWLMYDVPAFPLLSTFVTGPLTPPSGAGSAHQTTTAAMDQARALLFQPTASGLPIGTFLQVISSVTYNDYNGAPMAAGGATFNIFASYDGGATIGDTLTFVPGANGCFGVGAWAACTFSLSTGNFFGLDPSKDPDGNPATPFTLTQYTTFNASANGGAGPRFPTYPANPQVAVVSTGTAGIDANFDGVLLNALAPLAGPFDDILFDFEADCSAYGTDTDADCYCETADPTVLNGDQCPGVDDAGDTDGDGIHDCADNCPAVSNVAQGDADEDGDGDACDAEDSEIGVKSAKVDTRSARAAGDFLIQSPDAMNLATTFSISIADSTHTATHSFPFSNCHSTTPNKVKCNESDGSGSLLLSKLSLVGAEIWKYKMAVKGQSFTAPFDGPITVTLTNGSVDRVGTAATCISKPSKVKCKP